MLIQDCYNKDYTFVDVRTPKEFEEDTIPGAINIPLFENDERALVGTIYKKESKEKAIQQGLE
jgi:tRNA 2-selenouridine synthase